MIRRFPSAIAALLCILLPLAQLASLDHERQERHVLCAEHGVIEHAARVDEFAQAPGAARSGLGALPRADHDECSLSMGLHQVAERLVPPVLVLAPPVLPVAIVATPPQDHASGVPLLVAPKTSPPRDVTAA